MFNTMHLFAGAGGGLLADLILGHTPIVAVEWDSYACRVLRERASDGWFPSLEVIEGDVRSVDFRPYKGRVDCIHAGFPCTDIAICGPSTGIKGERSGLYSEAIRAIDEIRPKYVFLENSPEIVGRGLGDVLSDLAVRGYDAEWTELAASDVWGGSHRRARWWLLAHDTNSVRREKVKIQTDFIDSEESWRRELIRVSSEAIRQTSEPDSERGIDALADQMDQCKAIGNGQVPLCAAAAWKILGGPVNINYTMSFCGSALESPNTPITGLPPEQESPGQPPIVAGAP